MWLLHHTRPGLLGEPALRAIRVCVASALRAGCSMWAVSCCGTRREGCNQVPTAAAPTTAPACTTRQPLLPLIKPSRPGPRFGIPTDRHAACSHGSTPEVVSWHLAALHSQQADIPTPTDCDQLRPGCRDGRSVESGETGQNCQNSKAWRMVLIVICPWRSENFR